MIEQVFQDLDNSQKIAIVAVDAAITCKHRKDTETEIYETALAIDKWINDGKDKHEVQFRIASVALAVKHRTVAFPLEKLLAAATRILETRFRQPKPVAEKPPQPSAIPKAPSPTTTPETPPQKASKKKAARKKNVG